MFTVVFKLPDNYFLPLKYLKGTFLLRALTQGQSTLVEISATLQRALGSSLSVYAPKGQVIYFFSGELGRKLGIDLCNKNV